MMNPALDFLNADLLSLLAVASLVVIALSLLFLVFFALGEVSVRFTSAAKRCAALSQKQALDALVRELQAQPLRRSLFCEQF
jgi:hypothetical protein